MKKIAVLLTLCMMLAGCTELANDSTESGELTNQDLEGIYMAAGFGLYVDMNADDTYVVYTLEIEDCYDTEGEANSAMAELNDDEYFEDDYGSDATTMVANNCVYVQQSVEDEEGTSFNFSLSSHAGTPYIEMIVTEEWYEGYFVCDDGEEIPADWVNDGEDDCSGGEDEAEDAADSFESETMEVRVYLGADGYGTLVYPEGVIDDDTYCMAMGPSEGMFAFYQAMNEMENLSDEELENFDAEDLSTYPTILTDMFTVFDQNYAASAVSSLTSADCGELESMLMSWLYLWASELAESNTDGDSTESGELTNQDLEGIYMAAGFGLYVDMNADDTYVVYTLEIEDCYDTEGEANSAMAELNDDEYFEDDYGSDATTMVANNCVYVQQSVEDLSEEGTSFNFSLSSHAGTPYIEMIVTEESYEGDFVCDDGEEIPADWVNDGEDDCSGGEDEAEDAADSLEPETMEVRVYLAADGYGTLVYPEGVVDDDTYCIAMGPSEGMFAFYQAMNEMENLSDEELENFDAEDLSTYPTFLTDMFTVSDQNYAASAVSSLTSADCGELESMLMSWLYLWASELAESNTDGYFYDFDVIDASSETPTPTSGEDLVYVTMITQWGDDLNWSRIAVQMSVDGGYYETCTNPDQASDTECAISDNDDGIWGLGEEVTIREGSDDLCGSSCEVQIKILDMASNKLIYESSIVYVE